jgi:hypothetical protein
MSEKAKDLLLAAALIVVGAAALVAINTTRQTNISTTGALGFAVLPSIYAGLLILLALLMMATVVFGEGSSPTPRAGAGAAVAEAPESAGPTRRTIALRTWGTLALLLTYVVALPRLPFMLITAAYLSAMFLLYGQRSLPRILLLSIVGGIAFHALFVWALDLPL